MWHSDHDHSEEEIKVLRELEYDLFMYDPGFRRIWGNDFEGYFRALFDERAWEEKMGHVPFTGTGSDISQKMLADPEFAQFMKEQAIIDAVLAGELRPEQAPVEMRQKLEQMLAGQDGGDELELDVELMDEPEIQDPLYLETNKWAANLSRRAGPLYEQFGDIKLFRVLANCYIVAGKIAFAQLPDEFSRESGYLWQTDRVGYTLALTSLRRCLESLEKLTKNHKIGEKLGVKSFLKTAKSIRTQLLDRLDEIEQQRLQKKA